jgi:hypothetical protein
MHKHGQQQSPGQTVRNIVDFFLTQYIANLLARTLSYADFLKYLAESLDTIVSFHIDKINKLDFVELLSALLESFSQLTDEAFLRQILNLLNDQLGPKGFLFLLSNSDGTWRMTCEVKGDQPNPRTFAAAVRGGGSAASVVSPSATRSFASAVGGGGSAASAVCIIQRNLFPPLSGIRGNEVQGFLQNLVNSTTLALSIRMWLLASSFFENIFMTFSVECLSVLGIVPHADLFCSPFTSFLSAMFEGDSAFRSFVRNMLSKTRKDIVAVSEHFGAILRIILKVLDQPGQPILSEELFTLILDRLRQVQMMFDDKPRLQFRSQVVASLLGFYLIQIIDSADHKKRVQNVLQFKTMESIEQACKGDLESNFANSVNPHFFECSKTGCKINPRTLLVANTHHEAATRAKALGELQNFYETIARKKQEKMDGLEKKSKLRSSMPNLAVGGGCAAEVKPQISKKSECVVCMHAENTHAFIPCGHRCVCTSCGTKCNNCCPICRENVTGTLKIFDC